MKLIFWFLTMLSLVLVAMVYINSQVSIPRAVITTQPISTHDITERYQSKSHDIITTQPIITHDITERYQSKSHDIITTQPISTHDITEIYQSKSHEIITTQPIITNDITEIYQSKSHDITESHQSKSRPACVLHMGPSKTATSSIQYFLNTQEKERVLRNDSYVFIRRGDHNPIENVLSCMMKNGERNDTIIQECRNQTEWNKFTAIVRYYSTEGQNLIISNEGFELVDFTGEDWLQYENILKEYFDVRAVVAYRRFYDWLPSWYLQLYSLGGPLFNKTKRWPDNGGIETVTFVEYFSMYRRRTHSRLQNENDVTHPTLQIKKNIERRLNVHVINFHEGDIIKNFVSLLPGAMNTKNAANSWYGEQQNVHRSPYYDMLVVEAHKQGLIAKGYKRWQAAYALEHKMKKNKYWFDDAPLKCLPSAARKKFQLLSIEFEKTLFPEYNASKEALHNEGFMQAVDKKKFCSIDAELFLAKPHVKDIIVSKFGKEPEALNYTKRRMKKKKPIMGQINFTSLV